MVTSTRIGSRLMIIARPNQSASWRVNQLVFLLLAVPSLGIATGFALLGAWPILPFAGLELTALGSALYWASWHSQYRHVITVDGDSIRIDKGYYLPRQRWQFSRADTGLSVVPEQHPWDGPALSVQHQADNVPIGDFLNRDDCLELLALLREELRVRSYGELTCQRF